jgi:hypothetical protein
MLLKKVFLGAVRRAVVSGGRSCATHDQARYVYRPQVQLFGRDLRRSNLVGRLYDPEQLGGCAPKLDDLPADRLSLGPRGAVFLTPATSLSPKT